ncbi:hypothetical protein [Clavibacter zhangzhiyongii]|jgi:cold shock CspA family protein|uniref:hypothetical protein n=1 Tax=Clavibacter TaxID=1573 RepID=UPI0019591182|nr:hypothetical protein [Clavibacter zhangzhiyongii]MBM7026700.1 hypothetical protein [Clavibacter zhangzhiyongii]
MLHTSLRVDGRTFRLDADQDVAVLKSVILEAAGGAPCFLDFTAIGRGDVSVLIGPGTTVEFVVAEAAEDDHADQLPGSAGIDVGLVSFL